MKAPILLITLLITLCASAQSGISKLRLEQASEIKELPLLVILNEDEEGELFFKHMNNTLQKMFTKYWTYSNPVKFITKKELKEYAKDKHKANKYAYFMYTKKRHMYNAPKDVFCIGLLNKNSFTHFKKFGDPNKELSVADYKHGLYWLQKDLTLPSGLNALKKRNTAGIKTLQSRMPNDTLLIDEDLINEKLKKELPKIYKYNYKIVSKDVIDQAILDESPNILYTKSVETLFKPREVIKKDHVRDEVRGNTLVKVYKEKGEIKVTKFINTNIYSADSNDLLLSIPANKNGITSTTIFKKMFKRL